MKTEIADVQKFEVNDSQHFNWSRQPSKDYISHVFIGDNVTPKSNFNGDMTKKQLIESMYLYNSDIEKTQKIILFRTIRFYTLLMMPVLFFVYKVIAAQ